MGLVDPQACCDSDMVAKSMQSAVRLKALYCANIGKPKVEPRAPSGEPGYVQIGGIVPEPWVAPGGDPCADRCVCVHEEFHLWQVNHASRDGWGINQLECEAFAVEIRCLQQATRRIEPYNSPFFPLLRFSNRP